MLAMDSRTRAFHAATHQQELFHLGLGNCRIAARAAGLFELLRRLGAESFHTIGDQCLRVGIAQTAWQHARAHNLVEYQYRRSGFLPPNGCLPPASHNELVVVAMERMLTLGTVTLRMDRGTGLLADGRYQREIDACRATGAQVCEFSRFAVDADINVLDIVDPLLRVACRTGRSQDRPTQVFVECHPRHAAFYKRVLGFAVVGQETVCERVSAPAVLLQARLDMLDQAPALARRREQREREAAGRTSNVEGELLAPALV